MRVVPVGTYAVGYRQETFVDRTRATPANGAYAGAPDRTLETRILYPARGSGGDLVEDAQAATTGGPYPLVVFSHGFSANYAAYTPTTQAWASAGYVVALPNHPLSNTLAPGKATQTDIANQPADLSFVIDQVIELSKRNGPLHRLEAPNRIGAAGHSMGGLTTLLLAYDTCCIDQRVDAAIAMSSLGEVDNSSDTPLLLLTGDADRLYPAATNAFIAASPPKFFVTFLGGTHYNPALGESDDAGHATRDAAVVGFLDSYLKDDASGLDRLRAAVSAHATTAELQEDAGS